MPIEIHKAGERFGPHTLEELKVFLMQGDVEMHDLVLTEDRRQMSVGDYLQQPHPPKLRLASVPPPAAP